jgi:hypothetical protein
LGASFFSALPLLLTAAFLALPLSKLASSSARSVFSQENSGRPK